MKYFIVINNQGEREIIKAASAIKAARKALETGRKIPTMAEEVRPAQAGPLSLEIFDPETGIEYWTPAQGGETVCLIP